MLAGSQQRFDNLEYVLAHAIPTNLMRFEPYNGGIKSLHSY